MDDLTLVLAVACIFVGAFLLVRRELEKLRLEERKKNNPWRTDKQQGPRLLRDDRHYDTCQS